MMTKEERIDDLIDRLTDKISNMSLHDVRNINGGFVNFNAYEVMENFQELALGEIVSSVSYNISEEAREDLENDRDDDDSILEDGSFSNGMLNKYFELAVNRIADDCASYIVSKLKEDYEVAE